MGRPGTNAQESCSEPWQMLPASTEGLLRRSQAFDIVILSPNASTAIVKFTKLRKMEGVVLFASGKLIWQ